MQMLSNTLKVLVMTIDALGHFKQGNYSTLGGDVGSVRYELARRPPCPTIRALSYSNYYRDPPTPSLSEFSEIQHFKSLSFCKLLEHPIPGED